MCIYRKREREKVIFSRFLRGGEKKNSFQDFGSTFIYAGCIRETDYIERVTGVTNGIIMRGRTPLPR